ncbi:MAG: histidine triad nucleotide-binding protein [Candidatus Omnitrophica bacterium]|nr:histidine triad nucleotide-binding protein [Candidatus Omnitrophota bacterium]
MSDCLFCRIAQHSLPASIVAETDTLVAFQDVNPQAPTHLLIIPKQHIPTLADLTPALASLASEATVFANRLAEEQRIAERGYRLVVNCGAQAGQSVWHLHWHLLGGRPMRWPPG